MDSERQPKALWEGIAPWATLPDNGPPMPTLSTVDRKQVYRAFMEAFADYQMDASGTTEERLLLRLGKNGVDFDASVGAYDGERLVGFTMIGIDKWGGERVAFDAGTGIIPEFRKQGLAKAMFDHALPGLRERAVTRFVLEVLQENEPAIKAYTKSGFEVSREFRSFAGDLAQLRERPASGEWTIQGVSHPEIEPLESEVDWNPSFENRLSIPRQSQDLIRHYGAFEGRRCIGAISYIPSLHWVQMLVVAKSHRRKGVGTALLQHLAATLPDEATRLPIINVDRSDTGMEAFFESHGFVYLIDQYEMTRSV